MPMIRRHTLVPIGLGTTMRPHDTASAWGQTELTPDGHDTHGPCTLPTLLVLYMTCSRMSSQKSKPVTSHTRCCACTPRLVHAQTV